MLSQDEKDFLFYTHNRIDNSFLEPILWQITSNDRFVIESLIEKQILQWSKITGKYIEEGINYERTLNKIINEVKH